MKLNISHKMIKELCGIVSFKRGESYFRAKKVTIEHIDENNYTGVVNGAEDFHVKIGRPSF